MDGERREIRRKRSENVDEGNICALLLFEIDAQCSLVPLFAKTNIDFIL